MKYHVFSVFVLLATPTMTAMALMSPRLRGFLLGALVFSTMLGDVANINFMSMETYRGPDRGYEVSLTDVIAWALVLAMVWQHRRRIQWIPLNTFWMFLFFVLCCLSTLLSPEPLLGSFTLFKAVRVYLVYWCVTNALRIGTPLASIQHGFVAIGLLAAPLALQQKYFQGIYRIPLFFDHSNTVPPYLNLMFPMLLLWGLCDQTQKGFTKGLSITAAMSMVFAVVMTFSRAGTAMAGAVVVGCLCFAVVFRPSRQVGIASALVAAGMLVGAVKVYDSVAERIKRAPKESGDARDEFNYAAELMAGDKFLGVGLNNFSHVLTSTPRYRDHFDVMANEEQAGVAHHIYWLTAAELGYPGLYLFLMVLLRFFWTAFRFSIGHLSRERLALVGATVGFLTLHVSGFLEWALRISPVTFQCAIIAGITTACAESLRRAPRLAASSLDGGLS